MNDRPFRQAHPGWLREDTVHTRSLDLIWAILMLLLIVLLASVLPAPFGDMAR